MTHIELYKKQHSVCPKCFKNNYWKTLVGYIFEPEIKDINEVHCDCGWIGIGHDLVEANQGSVENVSVQDVR